MVAPAEQPVASTRESRKGKRHFVEADTRGGATKQHTRDDVFGVGRPFIPTRCTAHTHDSLDGGRIYDDTHTVLRYYMHVHSKRLWRTFPPDVHYEQVQSSSRCMFRKFCGDHERLLNTSSEGFDLKLTCPVVCRRSAVHCHGRGYSQRNTHAHAPEEIHRRKTPEAKRRDSPDPHSRAAIAAPPCSRSSSCTCRSGRPKF